LPAAGWKARGPLPQVEVSVQLTRICKPDAKLMIALPNRRQLPPVNDRLDGRLSR